VTSSLNSVKTVRRYSHPFGHFKPPVVAMPDRQFNLTVLISGNGSNLQALIDACASGALPNTRITHVISKCFSPQTRCLYNIFNTFAVAKQHTVSNAPTKPQYQQPTITSLPTRRNTPTTRPVKNTTPTSQKLSYTSNNHALTSLSAQAGCTSSPLPSSRPLPKPVSR
jgi:hypothetical protein